MEFNKTRFIKTLFFIGLLFSTASLAQSQPDTSNTSSNPAVTNLNPPVTQEAIAIMQPTKGNKVMGSITFSKVDGGVKIVAHLTGLSPGEHGFHIHEYGDCSAADASSAGTHFNPYKKSHGGPDQAIRHAGDFGNIIADPSGNASYERVDSSLALDGPNSIIGHGLIVHANADDLKSQPAGNSGDRIACGVIGIAPTKP